MVLGKPKKKKEPAAGSIPEEGEEGAAPRRRKRAANTVAEKWKHVPADELKAYVELFREIDADGSGGIDRGELRKAMRVKMGNLSEARIDEVFDAVDEDGNGELDVDEFIAALLKFKPTLEESGKTHLKSGVVWLRREALRARLHHGSSRHDIGRDNE